MAVGDAVRLPSFWTRFFQLVFGIVAFACVAKWADYSRFGYVVFVGSTTIVIALAFMALDVMDRKAPMVALIVDIVWWIFWLVAAALVSNTLDNVGDWAGSNLKASVAFSWLTWFLFCISIFLDFKDRNSAGGSMSHPPAAPVTAGPGAPAGAMV